MKLRHPCVNLLLPIPQEENRLKSRCDKSIRRWSCVEKESSSTKPQEEHETDTETETEIEETSLQTLLDKQTETISQRILADIETKIQKAINDATADLGKELAEQREYNRGLKDAVTSLTNKLKSQDERIVSLEASVKGAEESGRALRKLVNELTDKNEQ